MTTESIYFDCSRHLALVHIRFPNLKETDNLEPPRTEWFIAGTQPEGDIVLERQHGIARIVYPQPATIITLDPDIPADLQRVSFVGRFAEDTHEWHLDEKAMGSSASLPWKPERGRQVLSLVDRERNVVDSVTFIVK